MNTNDSKAYSRTTFAGNPSEPRSADKETMQARYRIENMDCPTEEALIRDKLGKLSGVTGLTFNLLQRQLTVSYQMRSLEPIEQALAAIGMHAVRAEEALRQPDQQLPGSAVIAPCERTEQSIGQAIEQVHDKFIHQANLACKLNL